MAIEANLNNINPAVPAGHTCYANGAVGLLVAETIDGNAQRYCECDRGLCADPTPSTRNLVAGEYSGTLGWHGRNWNGPSDTGEPEGAEFPPGTYVFQAVARGVHGSGSEPVFEVSAAHAFTLE